MNKNSSLNQEISNIVNDLGFLLYSIETITENHENIFRISIYSKDNNILLKDCTKTHKALYLLLEGDIADKYTIQVSSVGIEKPLIELWHYKLAIKDMAKIKTTKGTIVGTIEDVSEDTIKVIDKNNELIQINFLDIKKAKTLFNN